ncbi:MAG: proline--tRNA ligase [Bifidobacteriaceae bacterium]|jgi:prolyl-tRNA synthetase|nr:proline--tRNA ligase [Bifidobacteriaceae bacterium]
MSNLFVKTLREDPSDAEIISHKLLIRAGYIRRCAPGIYAWLPLGLMVLNKVEAIVRREMELAGAQEVHFPALLPADLYQASGRWEDYGPNMFRLKDRKEVDMVLAPTHEEAFTTLVRDMFASYKDLPLMIYQIQTKYRDEARPRAGLLRGREFIMKDAYSFDLDQAGLDRSYEAQRQAYQRIFARLGLETVIVSAMSGAMGGSRSEEFLHPTPVGEDTYVRSPGGYAANIEAVVTLRPSPRPVDGLPPAVVQATPDATTIATLVAAANAPGAPVRQASGEAVPGVQGVPWTAADTLKNVVVAVTHPDSRRELAVIGVPGDRDVDMTRLAAAMFPAEVDPATEEDFARHPELVRGYIGPQVLGANAPDPDSAVSYFLDPRVVAGTSWITGANRTGYHVFGLVAGRDFLAAGDPGQPVADVAEVLPGDPAPDGSGPLEPARGIEMGHIFQLGRKYADAFGLRVAGQDGQLVTVTMGSYGVGVTRAVAAVAEENADQRGLIWPVNLAPAEVHVIAAGKDEAIFEAAGRLAQDLEQASLSVLYDDRPKVSAGVKFADAELLGMPFILVVGRGLACGVVELKERRSGQVTELSVDDAAAQIRRTVTAASEAIAARIANLSTNNLPPPTQ